MCWCRAAAYHSSRSTRSHPSSMASIISRADCSPAAANMPGLDLDVLARGIADGPCACRPNSRTCRFKSPHKGALGEPPGHHRAPEAQQDQRFVGAPRCLEVRPGVCGNGPNLDHGGSREATMGQQNSGISGLVVSAGLHPRTGALFGCHADDARRGGRPQRYSALSRHRRSGMRSRRRGAHPEQGVGAPRCRWWHRWRSIDAVSRKDRPASGEFRPRVGPC